VSFHSKLDALVSGHDAPSDSTGDRPEPGGYPFFRPCGQKPPIELRGNEPSVVAMAASIASP
jgi:hypothetical protein